MTKHLDTNPTDRTDDGRRGESGERVSDAQKTGCDGGDGGGKARR